MKPQRPHKQQPRKAAPPWYEGPSTARQAWKRAAKATTPEYLPLLRQKRGELRASNQRVGQDKGWWNEYLQQVSGQQAQTQQSYADAATQTQGLINTASATDNAQTARLNEQAAATAALTGQTPAAQPAERGAAAQAQRNYLAANTGAATAAKGANQFAYLGEQQRIGKGQQIKSMLDEQARGRDVQSDLLNIRKERGGKIVGNYNELQKKAAEIALKRKAFGLETGEAKTKAAESQREARLKAEKNQREKEGQANENFKTQHPNAGEGKGGLTPSERNDNRKGKENALSTVHSFIAAHGYPKGPAAKAELEQIVAKESEVSPADASWAINRYLKRHPDVKGNAEKAINKGAWG